MNPIANIIQPYSRLKFWIIFKSGSIIFHHQHNFGFMVDQLDIDLLAFCVFQCVIQQLLYDSKQRNLNNIRQLAFQMKTSEIGWKWREWQQPDCNGVGWQLPGPEHVPLPETSYG